MDIDHRISVTKLGRQLEKVNQDSGNMNTRECKKRYSSSDIENTVIEDAEVGIGGLRSDRRELQ